MKTLGLYILIFGLGSLLLNLFGLELRLLSWVDAWGTTNGYLIRSGLIALGIFLMLGSRKKPIKEQFPELKEITESEGESPAEDMAGK